MGTDTVTLVVAAIGLVGVIVGAVIAIVGQWLIQRRIERQERAFITSNLVAALDQLVIDCARAAFDDGLSEGHPDENGYHRMQVSDPEFTLTANQANLRYLDGDTTYKVLIIPHRIKSISHSVSCQWEHDDPPDFSATFETRQHSFAQLGIDIARLSDQIRQEHRIPNRPNEIWNPAPDLKNKLAAMNDRRAKWVAPALPVGT